MTRQAVGLDLDLDGACIITTRDAELVRKSAGVLNRVVRRACRSWTTNIAGAVHGGSVERIPAFVVRDGCIVAARVVESSCKGLTPCQVRSGECCLSLSRNQRRNCAFQQMARHNTNYICK